MLVTTGSSSVVVTVIRSVTVIVCCELGVIGSSSGQGYVSDTGMSECVIGNPNLLLANKRLQRPKERSATLGVCCEAGYKAMTARTVPTAIVLYNRGRNFAKSYFQPQE